MSDTDTRTAFDIHADVSAILNAEFGEEWGDGYTVMNVISGYAEPGYGSDESVVILGDWNPKRFPRAGEPELTEAENVGPRLADALAAVGAEIEWYDEWIECGECYRAVRTEGDSYGWKPFYVMGDCEIVCADCARKDVLGTIEEAELVNNPHTAITWCGAAELTEAGFEQWEPGNPQQYANGWHPGQTDDPEAILSGILNEHEDAQVVFLIDANGQFDVHFSAWVLTESLDTDDEA